ncbi:MAG: cytochrome b N-terminal domain-containing protein [Myxococcota bacterium]
MSILRKPLDFVEDRTGVGAALRSVFDEQIEGGARWGHVFGNALLILFVVEAVTGSFLALTYTPTTTDAWSSVFSIQHQITNGWFIRGLHSYGGEAMLIVISLHILQTVVYGSYKKPHEFNWWLSLGLAGAILGMLVTGYRLPWDQHAYWALAVEMNIVSATPVVGDLLYELVAGGTALGQATLTRLYALHIVIIPGAMLFLFAAMTGLRRRNGWAAPVWADRAKLTSAFPGQVARDALFVTLVIVAVAVLTVVTEGVGVSYPAEPARGYPARPEWFLLPLYKLRVLLPASMEMVATMVVPGVVVTFLVALPILDRFKSRSPFLRILWVVPVLLIGGGAGALVFISYSDDAVDEELQSELSEATRRADRSVQLARSGIPPAGPVAMLDADPFTKGREIYRQMCLECHVFRGEGERAAPDHTGFGSPAWIKLMLEHPQDDHFFGTTEHYSSMPSQAEDLTEEELDAVVAFLFSMGHEPQDPELDTALLEEGQQITENKCRRCHMFRGDGDFMGNEGPNLTRWGSRTWILGQIMDPQNTAHYGPLAEMPAFSDQLTPHEARMVTAYLRHERFEEIDFTIEEDEE